MTTAQRPAPLPARVYLESGAKRVFACAIDWPGWCRSGRDADAALAALAGSAPRYARVAERAGVPFPDPQTGWTWDQVERIKGSMTTDFGAPGAIPDADRAPLSTAARERVARLVEASWAILDAVAATAPAVLRKGPRGGGRDRDDVIRHVEAAELAYARRLGLDLRAEAAAGGGRRSSGPCAPRPRTRSGAGPRHTPRAGSPGTSSITPGRSRIGPRRRGPPGPRRRRGLRARPGRGRRRRGSAHRRDMPRRRAARR